MYVCTLKRLEVKCYDHDVCNLQTVQKFLIYKHREIKQSSKTLAIGESIWRVHRCSIYCSCYFSVSLKFFKIKSCEERVKRNSFQILFSHLKEADKNKTFVIQNYEAINHSQKVFRITDNPLPLSFCMGCSPMNHMLCYNLNFLYGCNYKLKCWYCKYWTA